MTIQLRFFCRGSFFLPICIFVSYIPANLRQVLAQQLEAVFMFTDITKWFQKVVFKGVLSSKLEQEVVKTYIWKGESVTPLLHGSLGNDPMEKHHRP